jgi:multidrug efflux pump subunit AcrA (membrane-fusion protein)
VGAKLAIETPDGQVTAHITKIRSTLDAQTHRVPIEAELEASGTLRAGSFVRARVETVRSVPALRLPSDVLRAGSRDEVFVVDQGPKPKLAVKRIVHEPDIDGALLVRSGLGIDDLVVCAPSSTSKPGDAVEIADISASALEP